MPNPFKRATKESCFLRLALVGPAGSGKTYTALTLAATIGQRVALLDTEHGSAAKYADIFEFDTLALTAPFHPDRYVKAIAAAVEAGYDVLVIDSLSHAWTGEGGLLEQVDKIAARSASKNKFQAWNEGTRIQTGLIENLLGAQLHLIATMRSKTEYVIEENERGKKQPRKVGTAPVQRDGVEFEFDVVGEMDQENTLTITKSRCPELAKAVVREPGPDVAKVLLRWLGDPASRPDPTATQAPAFDAPEERPASEPRGNGRKRTNGPPPGAGPRSGNGTPQDRAKRAAAAVAHFASLGVLQADLEQWLAGESEPPVPMASWSDADIDALRTTFSELRKLSGKAQQDRVREVFGLQPATVEG